MQKIARTLLLISSTALSGCGLRAGPTGPPQVIAGPHNGSAYRLPNDQGFAEVVNEPEVLDRRSGQPTSIVVYFLQPDEKSSLTPQPTDVNATVSVDRGRTETLKLVAEPKSGDPAGGSRFASKPGMYKLEVIRVKLTATVGGQPFERVIENGH